MLRQGQQPLQVYAPPHTQQLLIRSLGQVLQNGHTIFGSFRLYSSGRRVNFLILMLADQQQKCTLMHVMCTPSLLHNSACSTQKT